MKLTLTLLAACFFLTGCFAPSKKHESYAMAETYQDGKLASRNVWRDRSKGGGIALFADPKASQIISDNVNQTALGGGSTLNVGELSSIVRPDAIVATGNAAGEVGNVIVSGVTGNPASLLKSAVAGNPATPAPAPTIKESLTVPGVPSVKMGDKVYRREPDIYGSDGKLYRFDGEKMNPLP